MGSHSGFLSTVLVGFFFLFIIEVQALKHVFNVMSYGAHPDGKTDNTQAFLKTWNATCQFRGKSVFYIPDGNFVLGPIIFVGRCNGPINFQIVGVIKAHSDEASRKEDHWLKFRYVDRLTINGGGTLDGQGPSTWPYNDCSKNPDCVHLPITIRFDFVTFVTVENITSLNSKNSHFNVFASHDVTFHLVTIKAPGNSPNTDGIHISNSYNINILQSNIGTGDDCISMGPGSQHVNISNVQCGPGHGISIGSLGGERNEPDVFGIDVRNVNFTKTLNGLQIKTWGHSYPSNVYNITFEYINVYDTDNPIVINQNYCPGHECSQEPSKVKITNVRFANIWGTSTSTAPVKLTCSRTTPCQYIELDNIDLHLQKGGSLQSICSNVQGVAYGYQKPPSCLH